MKSRSEERERTIQDLMGQSIDVKREVLENEEARGAIARMSSLVLKAYRRKKKVILFGNGGSAADAQHVAGELVNRLHLEREALPALALTTDTSVLTAIANDYEYRRIFARQVQALAEEGDVAIGLSTSGRSPNVIEGLRVAKEKGVQTVGLTGASGGEVAEVADLVIEVPSDIAPRIQETHIAILHIVCHLVEEELFGEG